MRMEIRSVDQPLDELAAAHLERRLRFALGRFEGVVDRVTARLRDVHRFPDGEFDWTCRVEVALRFGETVGCEASGVDLTEMSDVISDRVARLVTHHVKRHQKARTAKVLV